MNVINALLEERPVYGEIKKFRRDIGVGVIRAEDGRAYRFQGAEIRNVRDDWRATKSISSRRPEGTRHRRACRLAVGGLRRPQRLTKGHSSMTIKFKLADVPAVDAAELAAAMRLLIEKGQGLRRSRD